MVCVRNPDPGSEFERRTRHLQKLPDPVLLETLRAERYEGIIFLENTEDEIVGQVFFQQHGDELHLFSIEVSEKHRNQGKGVAILKFFLMYTWDNTPIRKVRIGADRNAKMMGLWRRFLNRRFNRSFQIMEGSEGWVRLAPLA